MTRTVLAKNYDHLWYEGKENMYVVNGRETGTKDYFGSVKGSRWTDTTGATREPARGRSVSSAAAQLGESSPRPTTSFELPRAASYTYLPGHAENIVKDVELYYAESERRDSEHESLQDFSTDTGSLLSSRVPSPERDDDSAPQTPLARPADSLRKPSLTVRKFILEAGMDDDEDALESPSRPDVPVTPEVIEKPPKSLSMRLSSIRRRSGLSSASRSPSPTRQEAEKSKDMDGTKPPRNLGNEVARRLSMGRRVSSQGTKPKGSDEENTSRRSGLLSRKSKGPVADILRGSKDALRGAPAVPSLPKSFSTDRLPSLSRFASVKSQASVAEQAERPPGPRLDAPKKKDELWTAFRELEAAFQKFQSKSTALKANVVRSSLLPFLRTHGTHPSNKNLRPEDLDRRASILNKWWMSLLETINGKTNQSVSGTDRPIILDAIAGIMERQEWRLSPSPFCPLSERKSSGTRTPSSSASSRSSSQVSDFLADSVHHNVRNIFVQNLLTQMAFVVDKMSFRQASASLVTFCGKACAYAFMFCPGIAPLLIHLWDIPHNTLKRVFAGSGVRSGVNLRALSEETLPNFPASLHPLKLIGLKQAVRQAHTPPAIPLGTGNLDWRGYWLCRWSGQESDLFYVFAKHYHILVADFLPLDADRLSRICAPGLLYLHAQILHNLDDTIHRQSTQDHPQDTASTTFDDVLEDPDASAAALPLSPANATRLMAENRIIMLLRDFLSDRLSHFQYARDIFAEAFSDILKAAARSTSIFDHPGCSTLCDFLEEAFVIMCRFEQISSSTSGKSILDWDFWLSVWKAMAKSENTMTEMRLWSFIHTLWNTICGDQNRKADLCLGFLLEPSIFESKFNHWCPMVRAYYMRLLCWRVARFDAESAEIDTKISAALLRNLHSVWAHYQFSVKQAEERGVLPPSTTPSNPAPGRRILIIRTDAGMTPLNSFLSFDGIVPNPDRSPLNNSPQKPRVPNHSPSSSITDTSSLNDSKKSSAGLLGAGLNKILGFYKAPVRSPNRSPTRSPTPPVTVSNRTSLPDQFTIDAISKSMGALPSSTFGTSTPPHRTLSTSSSSSFHGGPIMPATPHRNYSFKFSLEYLCNRPGSAHFTDIKLSPPRLPAPAHAHLQNTFLQNHAETANLFGRHVEPEEPKGEAAISSSRYAGRALAEWMIVVVECQNFFERRKAEGCPSNRAVECPSLGVETFAKKTKAL